MLTVFLHGMFAIEIRKNDVRLLAPEVKMGQGLMHEYRVGDGEGETVSRNTNLILKGVSHNPPLKVDPAQYPVLKGHSSIEIGQAYFTVGLPHPDRIEPRRILKKEEPNKPDFFDRWPASNPQPQQLPLLVTLVYSFKANERPNLEGSNWQPGSGNDLILQMRGEPGKRMAHNSMGAMRALLRLNQSDLDVASVYVGREVLYARQEERSLAELREESGTAHVGETVLVPTRTCLNMVLDNRAST